MDERYVYYLEAECDIGTDRPLIKTSTTCFTTIEKANKRVAPLMEKLMAMGFQSVKVFVKPLEIVE